MNPTSTRVHAAVIALASGTTLMVAIHHPPLAEMANGLLLTTAERGRLLNTLIIGAAAAGIVMAATIRWSRRRGSWPKTSSELVSALWPVTLVPVALWVFDVRMWLATPILLYSLAIAACTYCVVRTELPPPRDRQRSSGALARRWPTAALALAIGLYAVVVSHQTILNHRSLGTSAFDLGLQENALWNTLHGDLLHSSLMDSHYFGVHTSFVLLPIALLYAIAPFTETLLILQTVVIALAAWPLFVLTKEILGDSESALILSLIWLTHPAVAGANFYDFHPTVFAPVLAFAALVYRQRRRWLPFWIFIALLLAVKEDLSIVVVLLGLLTLIEGERRQGWVLVGVGTAAYILLQHVAIPFFAGGGHSYTWYYTEMIPAGEGPRGLLTTVLINPIHSIRVALTGPKILYLLQLFAPLALLPLVTARGWLLLSYGLASSLLATRPALSQLGFHYALPMLAMAFFAALLALERRSPEWRSRAITVAVMIAVVTCFHYGMIWPRHNFAGGFSRVDFTYTESDRQRYADLKELAAMIPGDASVLANEELVPHVSRRRTVETERYVRRRPTATFDWILVRNDGTLDRLAGIPSLDGLVDYREVERRTDFILLQRSP